MRVQSIALGVLFATLVSCGQSGPRIAPVHGRVMLDGRPLVQADVIFQPEGSRRASTGRTDANGRYELAYKRGEMGAIVGGHTVHLEVSSELVKDPPHIPARYASSSELHCEVAPGANEFNFDLTSDAE